MNTVIDLNAVRLERMAMGLGMRPTCPKCQGAGFLRRVPDPLNPHRERIVPVGMFDSESSDWVCWVCKGVGNLPAEGEAC